MATKSVAIPARMATKNVAIRAGMATFSCCHTFFIGKTWFFQKKNDGNIFCCHTVPIPRVWQHFLLPSLPLPLPRTPCRLNATRSDDKKQVLPRFRFSLSSRFSETANLVCSHHRELLCQTDLYTQRNFALAAGLVSPEKGSTNALHIP